EPFQKMSSASRPDGLLALAPQIRQALENYQPKPNAFFLVVEAIEKPSNLGAIIRSVDGAGADAIFVCAPQVDIFNADVARSSIGTFFTAPIFLTSAQQAIHWCNVQGITTLAATPQAETLYTNMDMRGPIAIAV